MSSVVITYDILVLLVFVFVFDYIVPFHDMVFGLSWLWIFFSAYEKLVKDTNLEIPSLYCYVSIDIELHDDVDWNFRSNLYNEQKDNFCSCVEMFLSECNWNAIIEVVKG